MNNIEKIQDIFRERDYCVRLLDAYGFEYTLSFDFWDEYSTNVFITFIARDEYEAGNISEKQFQYFVNAYRYIYSRLIKAVKLVQAEGAEADIQELQSLFNQIIKKGINRNKRIKKEGQGNMMFFEDHPVYGELIRSDHNRHADRWGLGRI